MRTITFNGHKLEMFDSITDTDIVRYQIYNRNALIDAGIGSDINGVNARINSIRQLIPKKPDLAMTELNNLQQSIYFVVKNTSPAMRSFASLVAKIDGRPIEDLSDEGIDAILSELGRKRLTAKAVFGFLAEVKKKWIWSLKRFSRRSSILRRSRNTFQS